MIPGQNLSKLFPLLINEFLKEVVGTLVKQLNFLAIKCKNLSHVLLIFVGTLKYDRLERRDSRKHRCSLELRTQFDVSPQQLLSYIKFLQFRSYMCLIWFDDEK